DTGLSRVGRRVDCLPALPAQLLADDPSNADLRDFHHGRIVLYLVQDVFPVLEWFRWRGYITHVEFAIVRQGRVHGRKVNDQLWLPKFLLGRRGRQVFGFVKLLVDQNVLAFLGVEYFPEPLVLQLRVVHHGANLRLRGRDALHSHAPEAATDHLLPIHLASELAQQKNDHHLLHVTALAQHQHANDRLEGVRRLLLLAQFPRLLPILFITVFRDQQRLDLEIFVQRLLGLLRVRLTHGHDEQNRLIASLGPTL